MVYSLIKALSLNMGVLKRVLFECEVDVTIKPLMSSCVMSF